MALIVEDGSVVSNANSYISIADFETYAAARDYTIVGTSETLLIKAMDYLEAQSYKGIKYTSTQALQWPRVDVVIDSYLVDTDTIPTELINAQCEVAMAIDAGNDPLLDLPRKTISEQVGPIAVTYADGSSSLVINRRIMNALYKLLKTGGRSSNCINVGKG